jgi:hypothetical protein
LTYPDACVGSWYALRMSGSGIRHIASVEDLIKAVRDDSASWCPKEPRWFRGEPVVKTALTPSLYRDGFSPHENALLQMFRARAPGFYDTVPMREHTDQWLFLARHAGLPTRLLDWLKNDNPVVWMLNPLDLNDLSCSPPSSLRPREFPLPWHNPGAPTANPAFENLRLAWEQGSGGMPLPVAIYPTYAHPRLRGQRSCFTIHGTDARGLDSQLAGRPFLKRYVVDPASRQSMRRELTVLGIADSVVFPDIDGLANELKERFS